MTINRNGMLAAIMASAMGVNMSMSAWHGEAAPSGRSLRMGRRGSQRGSAGEQARRIEAAKAKRARKGMFPTSGEGGR